MTQISSQYQLCVSNEIYRINEDLQKLILYLICGLKRVVKYLNDNKSMGKYLRRIVKKHSPTEIDFARINPAELSSVFCSAIKVVLKWKFKKLKV